jgi:hypothetical protein
MSAALRIISRPSADRTAFRRKKAKRWRIASRTAEPDLQRARPTGFGSAGPPAHAPIFFAQREEGGQFAEWVERQRTHPMQSPAAMSAATTAERDKQEAET